ncbi:MAG: hypothetical protein CML06_02140 [Pseudomonadales bacterium]|nr:hypothetical protein [Pseudomonadales bacterium]
MSKFKLIASVGVLLLCWGRFVLALPAEMEADRLILAAEEKLSAGQHEAAREYLQRVDQLEVTPEPKYHYLAGQLALHYGELEAAKEHLTGYVESAGRDGEFYQESLRMLTRVEEQQQSQEAIARSRQQLQQIQSGGGLGSGGGADQDASAGDVAGKAYDQRIQQLYIAPSLQESLVLHINSLLSAYQYLEGPVKNRDLSPRLEFRVSVQPPSQLSVVRKDIDPQSGVQATLASTSLDASGVNPFVQYRCSKAADQCVVRHPVTGADWLVIARDEAAARELSKALTRLIKALQR